MIRASEQFGANDSAVRRDRGPCLVAHQDDPRSLHVVAGIRRCLGPGASPVSTPLAEMTGLRPATGTVVVVLPPAGPDGVLGVIAIAVDLVERLTGRTPDTLVVVVAPRAVLRHRRIRRLLTSSDGVGWPDDDAAAGRPAGVDTDQPPPALAAPVQVLADRIAAWGVTDAAELAALHTLLDDHLPAPGAPDGRSADLPDLLARLRRAVHGFHSPHRADTDPALPADLHRLALEVRVVHAFLRICAPADHPHFATPGGRS